MKKLKKSSKIIRVINQIINYFVCDTMLHNRVIDFRFSNQLEEVNRIKKDENFEKNFEIHINGVPVNPITGERTIKNLVGKDSKENYNAKYLGGFYGGVPKRSKLNLSFNG